jgi:riboflavin transporter FmnP
MAKLKSLIKTGFGIGIGVIAAQMIFILLGLAFFVPGYIMFKKEKKDTTSGNAIGGIILMGIGVVLMGGVGLGLFINEIDDLF